MGGRHSDLGQGWEIYFSLQFLCLLSFVLSAKINTIIGCLPTLLLTACGDFSELQPPCPRNRDGDFWVTRVKQQAECLVYGKWSDNKPCMGTRSGNIISLQGWMWAQDPLGTKVLVVCLSILVRGTDSGAVYLG